MQQHQSPLSNVHISAAPDHKGGHYTPPDVDSDKEKAPSNDYGEPARDDTIHEGEEKFHKLGWKKLTICLIVEAIALGSLSLPSAFASLGMVAGVICTVSLGVLAMYTSYVVGQVKLKYPHVMDYADAVQLIWGKFGYHLTSTMFVLFLVLLVGSHALTGTIAWVSIVGKPAVCALVWSAISAVLLFLLALPPTFSEFAILGYIDFVSIIIAIGITIIATGIEASHRPGGLSGVDWTLWPPEDISFSSAFLSVTNIVFAYSFAVCQFSFMAELHTVTDYTKSIISLGTIEIFIYTVTGALVYAFVGAEVSSPALLSTSSTVSRIAFGIALPVIFISGSINATVAGRYIISRAFKNSSIKYTNTKAGWIVWVALLAIMIVIAWVIAEAIPFFSDLLGIISSLFSSGFSFYFPALFWFMLIREGPCFGSAHNIALTLLNGLCFVVGIIVLGAGTYASIADILDQYSVGFVRAPFTCDSSSFAA